MSDLANLLTQIWTGALRLTVEALKLDQLTNTPHYLYIVETLKLGQKITAWYW